MICEGNYFKVARDPCWEDIRLGNYLLGTGSTGGAPRSHWGQTEAAQGEWGGSQHPGGADPASPAPRASPWGHPGASPGGLPLRASGTRGPWKSCGGIWGWEALGWPRARSLGAGATGAEPWLLHCLNVEFGLLLEPLSAPKKRREQARIQLGCGAPGAAAGCGDAGAAATATSSARLRADPPRSCCRHRCWPQGLQGLGRRGAAPAGARCRAGTQLLAQYHGGNWGHGRW